MGKEKRLKGPCAIEICKRKSLTWKTVTSLVLSKGTNNKTLPEYIKENDIICLDCYNAIVINVSSEFQQHVLDWHCHSEPETSNNILSFSQAIGIVTDILYEREHKELPPIWIFKEFRAVMESEDK